MGEMIKFGIKIGLCVATAVALMAALLILFNLMRADVIGNLTFTNAISDIAHIIGVVAPFNVNLLMTLIFSLGSFKVAYWAADKMIEFINALG